MNPRLLSLIEEWNNLELNKVPVVKDEDDRFVLKKDSDFAVKINLMKIEARQFWDGSELPFIKNYSLIGRLIE